MTTAANHDRRAAESSIVVKVRPGFSAILTKLARELALIFASHGPGATFTVTDDSDKECDESEN